MPRCIIIIPWWGKENCETQTQSGYKNTIFIGQELITAKKGQNYVFLLFFSEFPNTNCEKKSHNYLLIY